VPNRRMREILWHRRETRRQTENTNFCLNGGKAPAYSPFTIFTIPVPVKLMEMVKCQYAVTG
jgi:hypothetical protein